VILIPSREIEASVNLNSESVRFFLGIQWLGCWAQLKDELEESSLIICTENLELKNFEIYPRRTVEKTS